VKRMNVSHGKPYYWNPVTGETSVVLPKVVVVCMGVWVCVCVYAYIHTHTHTHTQPHTHTHTHTHTQNRQVLIDPNAESSAKSPSHWLAETESADRYQSNDLI
jgi:hypothetical protein